jgi:hypothetical protein
MCEPTCRCGGALWLNSLEEVLDRGGQLTVTAAGVRVPIGDALVWECFECDGLSVVVTI